MPEIIVNSPTDILVDGLSNTSVASVLVNYASVEGIAGQVQAAFEAWNDGRIAAHADQVASLQATIADQQQQIVDLGGTDLARRLAAENRLKAAQEEARKAEAELAALNGGPSD